MPVIDCPDWVKKGEKFDITVSVGKEIPQPNTTEHHIRWIQVFFQPDREKTSYQWANCEFSAHGESVQGANPCPAYVEPVALATAVLKKPETIYALNFCTIMDCGRMGGKVEVS